MTEPAQAPFGTMSATLETYARKSGGWSRRVALCAFAAGAFMVLGVVLIILFGDKLPGGWQPKFVGLAVVYVALAALVLSIGYLLIRFSRMMRTAAVQHSPAALAEALAYERWYWRIAGVVTAVSLVSVMLSIAIPTTRATLDRSQGRRTLRDIQAIGNALEAYAMANHQYPNAGTIDDLARALEPRYMARVPRRDGWDRAYDYMALCDKGRCPDYRLASGGANRSYEVDPHKVGTHDAPQGQPSNDYVYGDGRFLSKPADAEAR